MHINIYKCSTAFLQRKPRKRNLLAEIESASHSASLLFLFNADIFLYIVSQNWSRTILFLLQISNL